MNRPIFTIVDVFTETRYAGNQLAVFRNVAKLSEEEMQKIAREMNYSETTFILSDQERNGGYDVRIFTPAEELPFAGHPTLGTAFIIQDQILKDQTESLVLNLKVGQIPVSFSYEGKEIELIWMKQKNPTFGKFFENYEIADCLNLVEYQIDERYPVLEVSTGLPFIIVPVKDLDSIRKARIDHDKFFKLIEKTEAKAVLLFSPETYHDDNDLNVRVFVDYYGIPEDPATGSANGCLAGYLVKHRYLYKSDINIRVEQGYEIKRPSLIHLRAEDKGDNIEVYVGGKVVKVAKGEFF